MSSSDASAYKRSGELSRMPVTLADHWDMKEHSDRALWEENSTEKDVSGEADE